MRPVALATSLIVALALGGVFSGTVLALDALDDGPVVSDSAAPGGVKTRRHRQPTRPTVVRGETSEPPAEVDSPPVPDAPVMRPEQDEPAFDVANDETPEPPRHVRPRHHRPAADELVPFEDDATQSRGAIRQSLNDQGFSEIDHLRRRGGVFIAEVTGPMGDRMRVVIDAQTGDIQGLRVLERAGNGLDRRAELNFLEQ
jgi:hypothetical protein